LPGATTWCGGLGGSTIRHRLASLASLFKYLCERNAVTHNPVKGVERPKSESGEGKTPALGDHQARKRLAAPEADTLKRKARPCHPKFRHGQIAMRSTSSSVISSLVRS
jgi:site-specific recombinase XerC